MLTEVAFQRIECSLPKGTVLGNPLLRVPERLCRELAAACAAGLFLGDKASVFQNAQMLHNRRKRHAMRPGKFADGTLSESKRGEYRAARGIGQRAESGIKRIILNHVVYYMSFPFRRQPQISVFLDATYARCYK